MLRDEKALINTTPITLRRLYDDYAGMLLGYINSVVKDKQVAEEYLVKIFQDLSSDFDNINWGAGSNWLQLRSFAQKELTVFTDAIKACEYKTIPQTAPNPANKYLKGMTDEQQQVFCSIYYHRYTTARLAHELNKPEAEISRLLKEAFTLIRQSHER